MEPMELKKVYFVVSKYDEGAWVSGDEEGDVAYATKELAEKELAKRDATSLESHLKNEEKRKVRFEKGIQARQILEAANFDYEDISWFRGPSKYEPYEFTSDYRIIGIEVVEYE